MRQFFTAVFFLTAISSTSFAQIFLNIDATENYYWFTGDDSGTPADGVFDTLAYASPDNVTSALGSSFFNGAVSTAFDNVFLSIDFGVWDGGGGELDLTIYASSGAIDTLFGNGTAIDYSSDFTGGTESIFEGLIGQELIHYLGTGYGNISIVAGSVSAVPEPAHVGISMSLLVGVIVSLRRKQSRSRGNNGVRENS